VILSGNFQCDKESDGKAKKTNGKTSRVIRNPILQCL